MKYYRSVGRFFAILLFPLFLQGCFLFDDEIKEVRSKIETIKSRKADKVPPPPKMKEFVAIPYRGFGKRDPFKSLSFISGGIVAEKCKITRPLELLEDYPLGSLSLVGTLYQGGQKWVLIQTADDGTVHKLGMGDHLGKNYGEIIRIGDADIEILEKIDNSVRGCVEQKTVLTIN